MRLNRWIKRVIRDYRMRKAVDAAWRRFWEADRRRRERDKAEAHTQRFPDVGLDLGEER